MILLIRFLYTFSIVSLLSILLPSCSSTPELEVDDTTHVESHKIKTEQTLFLNENPQDILQQAAQNEGKERYQLIFKAINILIFQNQLEAAQQQLDLIYSENPSEDLLTQSHIWQAKLLLKKGQPREALKRLPMEQILNSQLQIDIYRIRAKAFLQAGYPLESAKTRVQMERLLSEEFERQLNHQAIWEALSQLPLSNLRQLSQAPLHAVLLAWIELAKVSRSSQLDWQHLQENIFKWQQRYPNHPAAQAFARQLGIKQLKLIDQPSHIAILLPLTGQYTAAAAAIRDGIMSAYYLHPNTYRPKINFYDTSHNAAAIWNYYRKAVEQGADFIIGPFLKTAVNNLSLATQLDVPTLTLNYALANDKLTQNMFQFGLLPEDEARQAADMAYRQGRRSAAVLTPKGRWGDRLETAFSQRFIELGGRIVNQQNYRAGKNDFKKPIQHLLNIDQSSQRYRKLQRLLKTNLKFTPYRRQDLDMIFIAATPTDARQLKPQFRFHYAGDIPVYATSHIFSGQLKPSADRDLNEIFYTDMPWMLEANKALKQSFKQYWPDQQRLSRFFALGNDAYNLIPHLSQLKAKHYARFSGQTGNIYADEFNRLHRELLWAQFIKGRPSLIDLNQLPTELANDNELDTQQSRTSP